MPVRHVVIHQLDPRRPVVGGIDGFIRELIAHAPSSHTFALVGVDGARRHSALGRWEEVVLAGRAIRFLPVARLDPGDQARKVPHSARLIAGLLRYRPDIEGGIIHTHRAEVGAVAAALYPRVQRVQFIHGDGRSSLVHKVETFWRFAPRVYERFERVAVSTAACAYVMHTEAAARLRQYAPAVRVGRNWFDPDYFYPDGGPRLTTFGWAGRLEPPKDPLRAISVFEALASLGFEFQAWMAGSGTLEQRARQAIHQAGLSRRVQLVGVLSHDDLGERLRRTSALLLTSRWEGIPRIALQALACGVPVVSTDVGDISRVVADGQNGFVASPASVSELGGLLLRAAESCGDRAAVASTVGDLKVDKVVRSLLEELAGSISGDVSRRQSSVGLGSSQPEHVM